MTRPWLCLALVLILASSAMAAPVVLLVEDASPATFRAARAALEAAGNPATHCFPPHFLAGDLEWSDLRALPDGVRILTPEMDAAAAPGLPAGARSFLKAWRGLPAQKAQGKTGVDLPPPPNDVVTERDVPAGMAKALPYGALETDTSLYMLGSVGVTVALPESDATSPNTEDWTQDEIDAVHAEVVAGLDWWAANNPYADLSFVYFFEDAVPVPYEPIAMNSIDYWMVGVTEALGYPFSGNYKDDIYSLVDDRRDLYDTDWGFLLFVVDSSNDADGKFANDRFAFTVMAGSGGPGGPYCVMTYDNFNYGIANMDAVLAHETGHVFGALDQYSPCACTSDVGYLHWLNENCVNGCLLDEPSIMKSVIAPFAAGQIDAYARGQIGWVDGDSDGIPDILDTTPLFITGIPDAGEPLQYLVTGTATVDPLPAVNPSYNTATINTIAGVEYRLDGGGWSPAAADDGAFDGPVEGYTIEVTVEAGAMQEIEVRAVNSVGNPSASSLYTLDGVTDVPTARRTTLSARPNPFNPRTELRFRLAEAGPARLAIYDLGGRLVRRLADGFFEAGENVRAWDGADDAGRALPSGQYQARLDAGRERVVLKLSLVR